MDDKKKLILLTVLMVVAVITVIYGVSAPAKGKRGAIARRKTAARQEVTKKAPVDGPVERRAAKSKFTSWRRSPFSPKGETSQGSSSLTLNGVITDGKVMKAVIGDAIVKKGDKVGPYTVLEISKDSVVVNDGTGSRTLKLER